MIKNLQKIMHNEDKKKNAQGHRIISIETYIKTHICHGLELP